LIPAKKLELEIEEFTNNIFDQLLEQQEAPITFETTIFNETLIYVISKKPITLLRHGHK
jgi:hypothetical protein